MRKSDSAWQFDNARHFHWREMRKSQYDPYSSIYVKQFIDDVRNEVMPISTRSRKRADFRVVLSPYDDGLDSVLREAVETEQNGAGYNITEAISDFIADAAWRMAFFGETYFEVIHGPPHPEFPKLNQFFFGRMPYGPIVKIGNRYYQLAPLSHVRNLGRFGALIPSDDVMEIVLPKHLGRPRSHRQMLQFLAQSERPIPNFLGDDWIDSLQLSGFDLNAYNNRKFLVALRAFRKWGWIDSMAFSQEPITEYMLIYRHYIRFQRTLILIRNYIVEQLNASLRNMEFPSQIEIQGLPTLADIDRLERELKNGEISFDKVLETVTNF